MVASLFKSAVFRLTLLTVALLGLAAAAVVGGLGYAVTREQTARTEAALRSDVTALRRVFTESGMGGLEAAIRERANAGAGLYYLGDGQGGRRAGNLSKVPPQGTFSHAGMHGAPPRAAVALVLEIEAATPLAIARDIDDQRYLLAQLATGLSSGLAVLAFLGLGAGVLLARHIQARIDRISDASRAIMAGDLTGRIPRSGNEDELDRLSVQLNAMLDRIERLMAGMREVSDNIAHDLKTPLNRLRNRAETALSDARRAPAWREGLEHTIEDADELIKTFNALLLIARLEAGAIDDAKEITDAAEIAADVSDLYAPAGEDAGFAIALQTSGPAPIRANRQLIAQALANLIDNAIKYSTPGGSPRAGAATGSIAITVARTGDDVGLSVADRGPGIPAADRDLALRRFGRLEASRTQPGTGLGLSLVAAVARMHGGSVRLEDNAPGLRVTLVLPMARDDAMIAPGRLGQGTSH